MLITKKENYILITSDENSFSEFYKSFSEQEKELEKEHLILNFSNKINISSKDFLLFLKYAQLKKESGTSFVIISSSGNVDDFPENFNIVPTLIEAEDIIEMEAIERELGF
ncbi:hypothetical protein [uncultured Polaribacter sp.]|uniref:hypothetical protein n=1 Tax=uncultured Polaribacter sp. TaxID=174711 RepID=UPI00260C8864|nr:hypothetical protein [uncultured Polaribacter sp.]